MLHLVQPTDGTETKRAKSSTLTDSEMVDDAQLLKHIHNGTLSKLTIPQLKAIISSKGKKPLGKRKAEFVDQVESILTG